MDKEFILNENTKSLVFVKDTEPAQVYLNGTLVEGMSAIKDTEQGTTEVIYNSEYKKNLLNMAVEGNTTQKTTTGKNLIDPEKLAELIMSYDTNAKLMEVDGRRCINYRNSATYQKDLTSCCPEFKAKTRYIFSVEAKPYTIMPETQQYDGGFQITFKPTANSVSTPNSLSAKTTTEFTRMYTISKANTTVNDISLTWGTQWNWLIDLDTVYLYEYEGDNNPPYEEYTGRIPSPNAGQVVERKDTLKLSAIDSSSFTTDENGVALIGKTKYSLPYSNKKYTISGTYTSSVPSQVGFGIYTETNGFQPLYENGIAYTFDVEEDFYVFIRDMNGIATDQQKTYWKYIKQCTLYREYTVDVRAFPQPIENSTNVSAELSGVNLFDYENITYTYSYAYSQLRKTNFKVKPNFKYTIRFDYIVEQTDWTQIQFAIGQGDTQSYLSDITYGVNLPNLTKGTFVYTFTTKSETTTKNYPYLYFRLRRGAGTGTCTMTISNLMVVEGTQALPYEPYFPPTKVDIPSEVTLTDGTVVPLRFAKLGTVNNVAINKADTLTIDKIANKVTYTQYFDLYRPQAPYISSWYGASGGIGVYFKTLMNQRGTRQRGICSHGGRVGNYWSSLDIWMGVTTGVVYWLGIITRLGYNADWVDKANPTTEEWAIAKEKMENWLAEQESNGTPFEVLYELPKPIEYDLTNTDLGQQLLTLANNTQNATNIINISADVPVSKLNVDYAVWGGRDNEEI